MRLPMSLSSLQLSNQQVIGLSHPARLSYTGYSELKLIKSFVSSLSYV